MRLYWLSYHHEGRVNVVIQPGLSLMHARLQVALADLDDGTFGEGHQLDPKIEKRVPMRMIGVRLATEEAVKLLGILDAE
jgi:hypothetical protein